MEIDSKTIKALSADTRIRILKILKENRRIAADIAKELGLAPSTVNEHLKMMEDAGLIRKNDTGHKWIYYDITEKGKTLITPKMRVSIILTLSLGIGLALFGGLNFFSENMFYSASGGAAMQTATEKAAEIAETATIPAAAAPATSWLPLALLAAGLILIVFGLMKYKKLK